ncbi:hypothetical protein [Pelagerythrobacter sp.]|uniref:hypothetical protein n=1 Tax=Pelagerythrobacter sp. TaxID=2800702 RepID=UPI0035B420CB
MHIAINPKLARFATLGVLSFVLLGITLNGTGLFAPDASRAAIVNQVAGLIPALFFVAGIWMVGRAFRAISRGEAVEVALSSLMTRLGACLFVGGLAFVFAQPILTKAILGTSPWGWFDIPSITLGCLGLLLMAMARPLREAADARTELGEIL